MREWLHFDWLDVVGRTGAHNASTLILCGLGPFCAITATNNGYRLERAARVAFLSSLGMWVQSQDPSKKEPYVGLRLERVGTVQAPSVRLVPSPCRCMGLFSVRMMEAYLREDEPMSSGSLLMALQGSAGFRGSSYVCGLVSFTDPISRGSLCKTLTVWLWRAGCNKRKIADNCRRVHSDGDTRPLLLHGGTQATTHEGRSASQTVAGFALLRSVTPTNIGKHRLDV